MCLVETSECATCPLPSLPHLPQTHKHAHTVLFPKRLQREREGERGSTAGQARRDISEPPSAFKCELIGVSHAVSGRFITRGVANDDAFVVVALLLLLRMRARARLQPRARIEETRETGSGSAALSVSSRMTFQPAAAAATAAPVISGRRTISACCAVCVCERARSFAPVPAGRRRSCPPPARPESSRGTSRSV